jgi:peptide/nickel transport system substrate-binding protein
MSRFRSPSVWGARSSPPRRWLFRALILTLAVVLAGVGPALAQDEPLPSYIELADGETLAETQEITIGVNRNLVNGEEDFWYAHASLQVWEPLIKYDNEFRLQPGLAESWELSEDGLTWTFHLRDDAVFSNGTPYTSASLLASIEHARASSGRPSLFLGGINFEEIYGNPTSVTAVDDYTVQIAYDTPRPLLPYSIANHYSAQFEENQFDENSNFTGLPIGTGPFKLVEWERDQYAILERNENFSGEKPTLTKITVRIYPDANSRLSALKSGEVDALAELGAVLPAQAGEIRDDENFVVEAYNTACNTYLLLNQSKAPFDDVRIRQALNIALNREELVGELLYGYGVPAKGAILQYNTQWFNNDPDQQLQYDLEAATALLQEATGGERVKFELLFNPPGQNLLGWPYPLIAQYLQAVLQPVGFDIELKQLEAAAVTDALNNGEYEVAISNNCWATGDPNYQVRRTLGSDSVIQGTQHGSFNNPEVDALLDQAQVELDPERQIELYKEAQAIGVDQVAIAPLFDQQTIIAYKPWVRGLSQRIAYAPTLETVYLVEHD